MIDMMTRERAVDTADTVVSVNRPWIEPSVKGQRDFLAGGQPTSISADT